MENRPTNIEELKLISEKPTVVVDERGFINYVNNRFSKVFGWSVEEAIGEPLDIIIPEALREAHHMGFSRFLASNEATILDTALTLKAIDRAGNEFDAEHYIIAEKRDNNWHIGATVDPI